MPGQSWPDNNANALYAGALAFMFAGHSSRLMSAPAQELDKQTTDNEFLNQDIESFLANMGTLEISFEFGLEALSRYVEDLQMLRLGASYADLGIAQRRESKRARLIFSDGTAGTYTFATWRELYRDKVPSNSIALLQLSGVMRSESSLSSPGVDSFIEELRMAYASDNVTGIIIETNTGGGESMAGSMVRSAITEANKPVVGFGHMAASAGYRALSAAHEIIASSAGSEFGSIGTMISMDQKMLNQYRKRISDLYGTDAPKKNFAWRQALAGNFAELQKVVDEKTIKFQQEIAASRPLRGDLSAILNGDIFDGTTSRRNGLVDGIGNMQYAVKRVKTLAKSF